MSKRIRLMQPDNIGFAEDIESLTPRKLPADEIQTFAGFMDLDVERLLKRATGSRYVIWVDDRKASYTCKRIYACPVCGRPLKPYGVSLERVHGKRFTCGWVEYWRARGLSPDEKHVYNRVWSEAELTLIETTVSPRTNDADLPF